MTCTTAKPWSTQAATSEAKASDSCQVGPPWTRKTAGSGSAKPTGRDSSAWTGPPGPAAQTSCTGTEAGGRGPGGARTVAPVVDSTTSGDAASDQAYSTVPSGRGVASETSPRGVGTGVSRSDTMS